MSDEILGYRKIAKDVWRPIIQKEGYVGLTTASMMSCGKCRDVISSMGGPSDNNTVCVPCYEESKKMNQRIKNMEALKKASEK